MHKKVKCLNLKQSNHIASERKESSKTLMEKKKERVTPYRFLYASLAKQTEVQAEGEEVRIILYASEIKGGSTTLERGPGGGSNSFH
jgi:hypothetical protein